MCGIDLMREIIVRNFPLRSDHGGGDRRSHRVKIETNCSLFFERNDGLAETALDVPIGDRPRRPAACH